MCFGFSRNGYAVCVFKGIVGKWRRVLITNSNSAHLIYEVEKRTLFFYVVRELAPCKPVLRPHEPTCWCQMFKNVNRCNWETNNPKKSLLAWILGSVFKIQIGAFHWKIIIGRCIRQLTSSWNIPMDTTIGFPEYNLNTSTRCAKSRISFWEDQRSNGNGSLF